MPEKILEVKDLTVQLGNTLVFEHISFDLHRGETVAIIGPNGSGKTTLLKALLGLIPVKGVHWLTKENLGYVPQRFSVDRYFPLLTSEFLEFVTEKPIDKMKEPLFHKKELLHRRIGELSAGELQRVLIAGAVERHPSVLLLDEPTADLDVRGEETISQHIFHLKQEKNLTLVMVSHDLQVVFKNVDHVLCLNRELVCSGKPHDVLTPENLSKLYGGEVGVSKHAQP
jgi:ABC-type Mn2+/Zn2+ transport system ATPase subunit